MACEIDARTIPFTPERPYQLLALLAARAAWVDRAELAALFWSNDGAAELRRNLRRVLHAARRLECGATIESRAAMLRWNVATDLLDFDRALGEGRPSDVVALVQGPFAAGLDDPCCTGFSEWLAQQRDRVAAQWRTAALAILPGSTPADALALAERLLTADEFDDQALRAKLSAMVALGQRDEARRSYRDFALRMAQELGVEPDAATRALGAGIDAGASHSGGEGALARAQALVGRERELARAHGLLGADVRLLTLTGPGGVGKTRLARELAAAAGTRFAQGVVWVDLDDLRSCEQVTLRLAAQLDLRLTPGTDALAQVGKALHGSHRLLVFDNCEHLVRASPGVGTVVAALIDRAPRLAVLATSREALGIAAEKSLALDGLAWAAEGDAAAAILASPAARLFCERARTVRPDFDAAGQIEGIAAVCRLTEGLPLALELAAAWVRLLPCAEIAAELQSGPEVLEPRAGGRSVRAAFERSWQLASPHERDVLAALAVFPGEFDDAAAQAVAFARPSSLSALAEKSLLRRHPSARCSLHPLIRHCAGEKLTDAPAARRRHADHYSHWLRGHARFGGTAQQRSVAALTAELANCRAAFEWATADRMLPALARMAIPLWRFCELTGRMFEGEALFAQAAERLAEAALARDDAQLLLTRARVEGALASLLFRLGRTEPAEARARSALELAQRCGDAHGAMIVHNSLGLILWQRGRLDEAAASFRAALRRARVENDGASIGATTGNLAIIERMRGRFGRALILNRQVLEKARRDGDAYGTMRTLHNLGDVHRLRREWAASIEHFEGALQMARDTGYTGYVPLFLVNLALALLGSGASADAEARAADALASARSLQDSHNEAAALGLLAKLASARSDHAAAQQHLAAALQIARGLGDAAIVSELLAVHAEALAARGERQGAATLLCALLAGDRPCDRSEVEQLRRRLRFSAAHWASAQQAARRLELEALAAQLAQGAA